MKRGRRGNSLFDSDINFLLPQSKSSQVTLFIILGVIIIALAGGYFFAGGNISLKESIHPDVAPIHDFVSSCLEYSARESIIAAGLSGGYYPRSEKATSSGVVYYSERGEKTIPLKKTIEESISLYIEEFMPFCIDNFLDFTDVNVSAQELKVTTTIDDDRVFVKAYYPLTVAQGTSTYTLENFESTSAVRLDTLYELSEKIVDEHIRYDAVCIDCLGRFSEEYGVTIFFDDYSDREIIYTILDESSLNESYAFLFAIKSGGGGNEETIFGN